MTPSTRLSSRTNVSVLYGDKFVVTVEANRSFYLQNMSFTITVFETPLLKARLCSPLPRVCYAGPVYVIPPEVLASG